MRIILTQPKKLANPKTDTCGPLNAMAAGATVRNLKDHGDLAADAAPGRQNSVKRNEEYFLVIIPSSFAVLTPPTVSCEHDRAKASQCTLALI